MKKVRYWLALWLMRLAAQIDDEPITVIKLHVGRIQWDSMEWSHDWELNHFTPEYKRADTVMRELHKESVAADKLLCKIRFGRTWE